MKIIPFLPPPMTDQDVDDWAASADTQSAVSGRISPTPDSVIAKGQAVADLINARRGRK